MHEILFYSENARGEQILIISFFDQILTPQVSKINNIETIHRNAGSSQQNVFTTVMLKYISTYM